jgi:hypothetical protein
MKRTSLALLAAVFVLCGCKTHYVVKLTSHAQVTTIGKPKLKDNLYYCKNAKGEEFTIPRGRVVEIEPASFAEEEEKENTFKPASQSKKHWYWPF